MLQCQRSYCCDCPPLTYKRPETTGGNRWLYVITKGTKMWCPLSTYSAMHMLFDIYRRSLGSRARSCSETNGSFGMDFSGSKIAVIISNTRVLVCWCSVTRYLLPCRTHYLSIYPRKYLHDIAHWMHRSCFILHLRKAEISWVDTDDKRVFLPFFGYDYTASEVRWQHV